MCEVFVYKFGDVEVYYDEYGAGAYLRRFDDNSILADFASHLKLEDILELCDEIGWKEKNE